jgi:uncharacterized integral membrane protein
MERNHPEEQIIRDQRRAKWLRERFTFDFWFIISSLLVVLICVFLALNRKTDEFFVMLGIIFAFEFIILVSFVTDYRLLKRIEKK